MNHATSKILFNQSCPLGIKEEKIKFIILQYCCVVNLHNDHFYTNEMLFYIHVMHLKVFFNLWYFNSRLDLSEDAQKAKLKLQAVSKWNFIKACGNFHKLKKAILFDVTCLFFVSWLLFKSLAVIIMKRLNPLTPRSD